MQSLLLSIAFVITCDDRLSLVAQSNTYLSMMASRETSKTKGTLQCVQIVGGKGLDRLGETLDALELLVIALFSQQVKTESADVRVRVIAIPHSSASQHEPQMLLVKLLEYGPVLRMTQTVAGKNLFASPLASPPTPFKYRVRSFCFCGLPADFNCFERSWMYYTA